MCIRARILDGEHEGVGVYLYSKIKARMKLVIERLKNSSRKTNVDEKKAIKRRTLLGWGA